ncbi:MAG TPA: NAD(P)-dependent alcohol dehydrogenase [Methylophilaceae bacterium]|nr:NAD(P)-dependent alcohol dehydrogenase [Methylophilaceae bacterium]
MSEIRGWASHAADSKLEPYCYSPEPLAPDKVEISVEYCGLCHSDLSMLRNDWGLTQYPIIPGHEVVGRIVAIGDQVKALRLGQKVGLGWNAGSCMHCHQCMTGEHNLCGNIQPTIVSHHGGFAERVRAHWAWAVPLPDHIDMAAAGPLLCAGATVFTPLLTFGIKPTDSVGIVGIGGLGHLGLKFAKAWGCEVTAFTSNPAKADEARAFGAHHVIDSRNSEDIVNATGKLNFLLITVNHSLDWAALLKTLKPNGRMAIVGAVLEPMQISAIDLIFGQKRVAGSLNGGPAATLAMLEFAVRHQIYPQVEHFPMSRVNEAMAHLESGKARYRVVLDADFA